jgi:hypothetical protein
MLQNKNPWLFQDSMTRMYPGRRQRSKRSIHLPKNTPEYPQRICEYPWKTEKQIEFFYFPETTKNYQNLIKMITMKINGTISRHNSCYMFKKENCSQKQQIIIAWLGIEKLAVFLYFDLYETMNIYYILSFYSKYNFTK